MLSDEAYDWDLEALRRRGGTGERGLEAPQHLSPPSTLRNEESREETTERSEAWRLKGALGGSGGLVPRLGRSPNYWACPACRGRSREERPTTDETCGASPIIRPDFLQSRKIQLF